MDIYTDLYDLCASYGLDGSTFGAFFVDIFSVFFGTLLLFGVPLIIIAFVMRLIRRW